MPQDVGEHFFVPSFTATFKILKTIDLLLTCFFLTDPLGCILLCHDRPGNDLEVIANVPDIFVCQKECENRDNCLFSTLWRNKCFLKQTFGDLEATSCDNTLVNQYPNCGEDI